ncbi:kelch domain-containing protein 3 [Balamuthia mandrillaris]
MGRDDVAMLVLLLWRWATIAGPLMAGFTGRAGAIQNLTFIELAALPPGGSNDVYTTNYKPSEDETWYVGPDADKPFVINWKTLSIRREATVGAVPRWYSAMSGTAIIGDTIYNLNGRIDPPQHPDEAWALDTTTKVWSQVTPPGVLRRGTTSLIKNNKLWVWGGFNSGIYQNLFTEYNPETRVWTNRAGFGTGAAFAAGVTFGPYLIFHGGEISNAIGSITSQIIRYDPTTLRWSSITSTRALPGRRFHKMFADEEELTIWIVGGLPHGISSFRLRFNSFEDTTPEVEEYGYHGPIRSMFLHPVRKRVFVTCEYYC